MIKKLLSHKIRILLTLVFLFLLIGVRAFENQLFYDPFLAFFKTEYKNESLPFFKGLNLFFGILSRYGLNTFFSLVLIYLIFKESKLVVFSAWLYVCFFILLIGIYFGLLYFNEKPNYLVLFYVRRFLIQPLFLPLFIAAFCYQKKTK